MNKEYFLGHWYADIYEQKITETDEAEFVLSILKEKDYNVKNILEIACGGGRNTIPLAKAGYKVTGFDMDEYMLRKLQKRVENENLHNNISWQKANAITHDWGKDFDAVIMAGNIFINIVTNSDYAETQELFLKKAADCVKFGGYLYLDFDCYDRTDRTDETIENEWIVFEGVDDIGTYGKYIAVPDYKRRYEITPKDGEKFIKEITWVKHFPTFAQTKKWLDKSGWEIEQLYGGRNKEPFDEKTEGNRAVIWAKKI